MIRKQLLERPSTDALKVAPSKFLRAQSTKFGPLNPDAKIVLVAVKVNRNLSKAGLDQLETVIAQISVVDEAKVAITGKAPSAVRVPDDYDIYLRIDGQMVVEPKVDDPEE